MDELFPLIWNQLRKPDYGIPNSISNTIYQEKRHTRDLLTTVRQGPDLILASNYGGKHKVADFETLSFLLADVQYLWLWDDLRLGLRKKHHCKSDGLNLSR